MLRFFTRRTDSRHYTFCVDIESLYMGVAVCHYFNVMTQEVLEEVDLAIGRRIAKDRLCTVPIDLSKAMAAEIHRALHAGHSITLREMMFNTAVNRFRVARRENPGLMMDAPLPEKVRSHFYGQPDVYFEDLFDEDLFHFVDSEQFFEEGFGPCDDDLDEPDVLDYIDYSDSW